MKKRLILLFILALPISAFSKCIPDTLISLGEVDLNFRIIKGSGVNILFESGGGDDLTVWDKIAPETAKRTGATVICYDRAGFGKSSLTDIPHSIKRESEWLWECLTRLGLNKNLILAGHSFGGWMIRMTSYLHPDAVKGILFIDPFSNEIVEIMGAATIDAFQKPGTYKELGVKNDEEFAALQSDKEKQSRLTRQQKSSLRFWGKTGTGEKYIEMKNTIIPSGIPVKIITSGKQWLPDDFMKSWRASHERLNASIKDSELIVAKDSDHYVIFREPELVIEQLTRLVNQVTGK